MRGRRAWTTASRSWMTPPGSPWRSSWLRLLGACRCIRWLPCRGYYGNGGLARSNDSLDLWPRPSWSRPGASTPSSRHSCTMGTIWGAPLEPATFHCTLGVKEVSPFGRAQLSAPASLTPCPAACPSWPRGVEVSATRSRTQVSGLARAPSGAWGRGRLLANPGGAWHSGRCLVVWKGLRFG